ncbi:MAG: hypothetical protein RL748_4321 [Pseudomonadota bacterium]
MTTLLAPATSSFRLRLCATFAAGMLLSAPGFASDKTVVIAQSIDLSGPNGALGRDYVAGITSYFDSINSTGGVAGRRIRFVVRDDKGEPQLAAQMARELVEQEKPQYMLGGIGPDTTAAILSNPAFNKSGLVLYAPLTDATSSYQQRALVWRPNKEQEIQYIFSYFEKLGIKNIGVAYTESVINREAYALVQKEIQRRGLTLSGSVILSSDTQATVQQIHKLGQTRPNIVISLADTINTGLFLKSFRKASPKTFVAGTSLINLATLTEIAGATAMEWTLFSQVVPNPNSPTTALQLEHLKSMKKFRDESVSAMSLEGFAVAKTLVRAIHLGAGNSFTAMQGVARSNSDLGGLNLVRTEGSRNLSQFVDLALFRRGGNLLY